MGPAILIVDGDLALRNRLAEYLAGEGYRISCAADVTEMDGFIEASRPDLIVLDVVLRGEDGFAICRRLTADGGPSVIVLSAAGGETDRVLGLEFGADDYLAKPCSPRELLARICAVLRRRMRDGPAIEPAWRYQIDGFTLETPLRILRGPSGVTNILSLGEMTLLLALCCQAAPIRQPRRTCRREKRRGLRCCSTQR